MKYNPHKYQSYATDFIISHPIAAVFLEMGLGKSIITLTAINALRKLSPIRDMVVSTYQAVSGAGAGGPIELQNEVDALRAGKSYAPKVFAHQIAYNVIPQIGGEQCDGYTSEEMKLQNEGRKILHLPDMNVACTCVRVPVVRSHSISAAVHFAHHISVDEARAAFLGARVAHDDLLVDARTHGVDYVAHR